MELAISTSSNTQGNPYPTEDIWAEQLQPIPNKEDPFSGFDYGNGSCLHTIQQLRRAISDNPDLGEDNIWTVSDDDEGDNLYIGHGTHYVNALGYLLTRKTPLVPITEDILVD